MGGGSAAEPRSHKVDRHAPTHRRPYLAQKDAPQADQPHVADQAGAAGAAAPADGAVGATPAEAGGADKRKTSAVGAKTVSIAPKAAFLDPSRQEGEMSIKASASFTAPGCAQQVGRRFSAAACPAQCLLRRPAGPRRASARPVIAC